MTALCAMPATMVRVDPHHLLKYSRQNIPGKMTEYPSL